MKRPSLRLFSVMLAAGCLTSGLVCCNSGQAQTADNSAAGNQAADGPVDINLREGSTNTLDKEWYYGRTANKAESKSLGRQKAELRARQRLARVESMRWYGFSASRPTATGIPFTSMYSPAWTRPGGRPFAWYTSQRPVVIVSPYYRSYYRYR